MSGPLAEKFNYKLLCQELGHDKAHAVIAAKLRAFADAVEKGDPMIFACEIDNVNPTACGRSFIEGLSITLSYPWPG